MDSKYHGKLKIFLIGDFVSAETTDFDIVFDVSIDSSTMCLLHDVHVPGVILIINNAYSVQCNHSIFLEKD